jgi:hypothetical protein
LDFYIDLVLNTGGQNEAIKRNLENKEKQKKQLLQRIEEGKTKQKATSANNDTAEEVYYLILIKEFLNLFL